MTPLWPKRTITSVVVFVAAVLLPSFSAPAWAQASEMAGIGDTETVTVRATVKAIDLNTRTVTLVGPQGETKTLKVGEQVQNLAQVKPGDIVVARYYESEAYVIAPPGTKLPEDAAAVAAARAAPGQMPAGGVVEKIRVTGLAGRVNPAAHTISLVDPKGGEVRTINVKDPQYQQMLNTIKVGDTITAYVTEAVIAVVEPTR